MPVFRTRRRPSQKERILNIWYVHHYGGGPGIGLYDRPYQLARAWRHDGHSATIFIARFHHLLERQVTSSSEFFVDDVRYVTVPARSYSGNGWSRLLNIWDFSKNLYGVGKGSARDLPAPDAIVVSSPHPFAIYPAYALARRYNAKLVFEIRDIWPLSITEIIGTSYLHPFVALCSLTEKFALQRSDLVASVLPLANRYLCDRGYGEKPFVWVPNGIVTSTSEQPKISNEETRRTRAKLREWRSQGKVSIIYTGSIGVPNAIDLLLKALLHGNTVGEGDRCGAVIVGRGDQLEVLRRFASDYGISNVHFSGFIPKADAMALLGEADIGYAGLRDIPALFSYGVSPNKIADYFRASLPVALPISPCGDPVSESGGGIARKAQAPDEVWRLLDELIRISPEERRALGQKGRAYMEREYDYDLIAKRYIEAIARA